MEVSIQAVSPEFGEQLISILASHDGVGGSGSGVGVGGGVCADDGSMKLRIKPSAAMTAIAMSATRANLLNVMELLLSKSGEGAGVREQRRRSRQCGCARHRRCRRRRSFHRRS